MKGGARAYVAFEIASEFMTVSDKGEILVSANREQLLIVSDGRVVAQFEEKKANQPPLRMPVSGTPAAGAPVAPPPGTAGR
jgi:hypothetical protein